MSAENRVSQSVESLNTSSSFTLPVIAFSTGSFPESHHAYHAWPRGVLISPTAAVR